MQIKALDNQRLRQACQQQLFTLERKLRTANLKIEDIGDFIPGNVMVQDVSLRKNLYMNKCGCEILGHCREELEALGPDYFKVFFPEEETAIFLPEILRIYHAQNTDEVFGFFQRVRRSAAHDYRWYYTCSKLVAPAPGQKTHRIINIANEVNSLGKIVKRSGLVVEEKDFNKKNYPSFAALTVREKEILRYLALGNTPKEIAEILSISRNTVHSHHNNICNKLQINSYAGLVRFACSFDLN